RMNAKKGNFITLNEVCSLMFGVSLELEVWSLELEVLLGFGIWIFGFRLLHLSDQPCLLSNVNDRKLCRAEQMYRSENQSSDSGSVPCCDCANSSFIRSRVRNIRLIVLSASTLDEFVNNAGAAMNVSTANGLCVSET